jgi:hypothetical protein
MIAQSRECTSSAGGAFYFTASTFHGMIQ